MKKNKPPKVITSLLLQNRKQSLRLCLRVWRGREGKAWKKRNEQVEEIEENGRGGLWGVNFIS